MSKNKSMYSLQYHS